VVEEGQRGAWRRKDQRLLRERKATSATGEGAVVSSQRKRVGPFETGAPVQWGSAPPGSSPPPPGSSPPAPLAI